jgi:NAD(P)-dependent dehydrogenase (short-subunit alcohol dehydrogenase family)
MKLAGKVAVVTGVTSEMGKAIALRLASLGDCAAAVAHLASPDTHYVTGAFLSAGAIAR